MCIHMNYILYHVHLHDLQRLQLFGSQDLTLAQMFCRFLPASGDSLTGGIHSMVISMGTEPSFLVVL